MYGSEWHEESYGSPTSTAECPMCKMIRQEFELRTSLSHTQGELRGLRENLDLITEAFTKRLHKLEIMPTAKAELDAVAESERLLGAEEQEIKSDVFPAHGGDPT